MLRQQVAREKRSRSASRIVLGTSLGRRASVRFALVFRLDSGATRTRPGPVDTGTMRLRARLQPIGNTGHSAVQGRPSVGQDHHDLHGQAEPIRFSVLYAKTCGHRSHTMLDLINGKGIANFATEHPGAQRPQAATRSWPFARRTCGRGFHEAGAGQRDRGRRRKSHARFARTSCTGASDRLRRTFRILRKVVRCNKRSPGGDLGKLLGEAQRD
jgi:hypothetical protein